MDAKLTLQKCEDAIHRATPRATPDEQVVSHSLVGETLVVGIRLLGDRLELHPSIVADDDAWLGIQVVSDGQADATHLFDVLLQLTCSRFLGGGGSCRYDNLVVAPPIAEEPVCRIGPYGQQQKHTDHRKPVFSEDNSFHRHKDTAFNSKFKIYKFKIQNYCITHRFLFLV